MKTEKNILIAFLLNLFFSIFEFFGGLFTSSVAIMSDSIHDLGDAISIGISYFLEKKSKQKPNDVYTYGYVRYSIIGSFITTVVLLVGTMVVVYSAIKRIINPVSINYNGMLVFAIIGLVINFIAAYSTREGDSLNQKAVNLHMLEDVFGWAVVLVGSIIMKFTDFSLLDSILSLCLASFLLVHIFKNLKSILDLFLEKTPKNIDTKHLKEHLLEIEGVKDVHHIHIWSLDGVNNFATMHVVSNDYSIKKEIREELKEHGINHTTIEIENEDEECEHRECKIETEVSHSGHHHHH